MAARNTPSKGGKPDKQMRDALMLDLHEEQPSEEFGGKRTKRMRLVARALVNKAIAGDVQAAREIIERVDGKVPQGLDVTVSTFEDYLNAIPDAAATEEALPTSH